MLGEPPFTHPSELRVVHAARYPRSIEEHRDDGSNEDADDEQHMFTTDV